MLEKIAEMLGEQFDVDPSSITAETDIIKDLGADSLDIVELLMGLEENTGKTIPEDKISDIRTVGDIIKVLEEIK